MKVAPEGGISGCSAYDSVTAGYHLNKESLEHDYSRRNDPRKGDPPDDRRKLDLVTDSPTKRIYEAVKQIPKGHVATYGQIAAMAGEPKMARAVGNALHKNPDPEHIPCFRVVNAKGELAGAFAFGGEQVQARLLEEDGVEVVDGKVDLDKYGMQTII